MQLNKFQKTKLILVFNFTTLFVLVLFTPFWIKSGIGGFSEEVAEAFFLAIELLVLVFVFRHYDSQIKETEEQASVLNSKLEKKEKELLGALEYLGKVNVQVSMIKGLFEKMQIPSSKNQLKEVCMELLRVVCNITRENQVMMRIIDLKKNQTLLDYSEKIKEDDSELKMNVGNKDLVEFFQKKKKDPIKGMRVFYSDSDNFSLKAFILVPDSKKERLHSEQQEIIKAIANQCEVVFSLFNSKYHRSNNKNNK